MTPVTRTINRPQDTERFFGIFRRGTGRLHTILLRANHELNVDTVTFDLDTYRVVRGNKVRDMCVDGLRMSAKMRHRLRREMRELLEQDEQDELDAQGDLWLD